MEREKQAPQLPYGVSPVVRSFLLDCIQYDVVPVLDTAAIKATNFIPTRHRNLIGVYYGSDATTYDLAKIYSISRTRVNELIKEGMLKMWTALPENIQNKYDQKEIIKLKTGHSPKTIEKFKRARKGQPSPFRGIKRSPESVKKNIQISMELWQNSTFRERTMTAQKESREKKQRTLVKEKPEKNSRSTNLSDKKEEQSKILANNHDLSNVGEISIPESVLRYKIRKFKRDRKQQDLPTTIDDVCSYLEYLGINYNPQLIAEICKKT